MAKRGQLVVIAIITLVIAAFIGFMLPHIAKASATGTISFKSAASKDIALIIDILYAYPYDMEFEYDADLSKFIVSISKNSVEIYDASLVSLGLDNKIKGIDPSSRSYSFVSGNEDLNFILDKPKKIIFKKEDEKLKITKNGNT